MSNMLVNARNTTVRYMVLNLHSARQQWRARMMEEKGIMTDRAEVIKSLKDMLSWIKSYYPNLLTEDLERAIDHISELDRQLAEKDQALQEANRRLSNWQQGYNRVGTDYDFSAMEKLVEEKDAEIERLWNLYKECLDYSVAYPTSTLVCPTKI